MARISEHHRAKCGVEGKCSVPMWHGGSPSGFCDKPAFGQQYSIDTAHAPMHWHTPGHSAPYAPDLCCKAHGGPSPNDIRFVRDGNMWCAFMPDFENLQESEAGFGETQAQAERDLRANLAKAATDETDCEHCDGYGRVWNNADPTSGQFHQCEVCLDQRGAP